MPDKSNSTLTMEDLKPFWGKTTYYDRKFASHIQSSKLLFFSWNWTAFLVPHLWLIYRKMYWEFFLSYFLIQHLLILFMIVAGFSPLLLVNSEFLDNNSIFFYIYTHLVTFACWFLGIGFFWGLYGNSLYLQKTKRRFLKNSSKKGTNKTAVWIIVVSPFLLVTLLHVLEYF